MNPNSLPERQRFLELDKICDQFEQSWQTDQIPSLAAAVSQAAENDHPKLLGELLLIDLRYRRECGQELSLSQYQEQLPAHAQTISDVFVRLQTAGDTLANKPVEQLLDTTRMGKSPELELSTLPPGEPKPASLGNVPAASSEFGDYQLLDEIGRGGMGVVYKAHQKSLGREVAVKMILTGGLADQEAVERFYAEAQAVAQLRHPNIVRIYEVGQHQGHHFFSMEYIPGKSLAEVARSNPLSAKEAADYVRTISEAIHYAHEAGIIHRDLKPSNILTDSTAQPLITDFGLAKRSADDSGMTKTGKIMGTPSYMPPEQVGMGEETISPASDVYALGAILYELLTGRPPFRGESSMETLLQVLEQEPVPPRVLAHQLDRDLETITLKCLQKKPAQRYTTAAELAAELGRYWNDQPIHARPVSQIERVWKWSKRRPAVAALSATVMMLLLIMGILGPGLAIQQSKLRNKAEKALAAQRQAERERRSTQANAIRQATPQAAAMILRRLDTESEEVQQALRAMLNDPSLSAIEINRIRLGLLATDQKQLEPILEFLLSNTNESLDPEELVLIRDFLVPYRTQLVAHFLPLLQQPSKRLRAACFLAGFAPQAEFWPTQAGLISEALVNVLPSELGPYRDALRPVRQHLIDPLSAIFRDDTQSEETRLFSADTLAEYQGEEPAGLFDLLTDAEQKQFPIFFEKLVKHRRQAIALGNTEITKSLPQDAPDGDKEALAIRQANAAVMLLMMKAPTQVWPLLKHTPGSLRTRSYIIHRLSPLGGDPKTVISRFQEESDVTIKRALLLCLGEFNESQLTENERTRLTDDLLILYRNEPDAGLHGACEWLLRQWGHAKQLTMIDSELQQSEQQLEITRPHRRQWYINSQGQTFVIFYADKFQMGSPESEIERQSDEPLHQRRIDRHIAISTKEVTKAQWRAFNKVAAAWPADQEQLSPKVGSEDSPITSVTWFEALWYCNWLSEQEGIPKDQWCYSPTTEGKYGPGMQAKKNFLQLTGYRLPTEAEWEYACRAESRTRRHYGQSAALLQHYGWYQQNSENHNKPVGQLKPNDLGLFDMHGNNYEWCYDAYGPYLDNSNKTLEDTLQIEKLTETKLRVIRGGAFVNRTVNVRSANRDAYLPAIRNDPVIGFRTVRTYPKGVSTPAQIR